MIPTILKIGVATLIALLVFAEELVNIPSVQSHEVEVYANFGALISSTTPEIGHSVNVSILDTHDVKENAYGGQCVTWIQRYLSSYYKFPQFRGHAKDIQPNAKEAEIGEAVLTNEGEGHAALIIAIDGNDIVLAESNFKGDERITKGRIMSTSSPKIRGYFKFE